MGTHCSLQPTTHLILSVALAAAVPLAACTQAKEEVPDRRPPPRAQASKPPFYAFRNGLGAGPAAEAAALVKGLGYDGIGSVEGRLVKPYLRACDEAELQFLSTYVGGTVTSSGFSYDPGVRRAIELLEGRDALVELFVKADGEANDEQAAALATEIAGLAKSSGLKVVLYPHANFYIETIGDAVRIAKASGCSNVGVTFNLCHFLKVEPTADLRRTLENAGPLLWSVSIAGADADGAGWSELIRPLDEGDFEQSVLLHELRRLAFRGPIGLQCYGIQLEPSVSLERSMAEWRSIDVR